MLIAKRTPRHARRFDSNRTIMYRGESKSHFANADPADSHLEPRQWDVLCAQPGSDTCRVMDVS